MSERINILLSCLTVMLLCGAVVAADPPADPPAEQGQTVDQPADAPQPDGHGQHSRRARRTARQLTDEQEAELLEFFQEHMANRYEVFVKLAEDNPRLYRFIMARMWAWYQQWKDMSPEAQEASIAEHDLRMEAFMVLRQWRKEKDPEEKKRLKAQLRETLEQHFDAEQRLQEVQLAELEQRIEQVRQEIQQRAEDRDSIVTEHMERMLQYRRRRDNQAPGDDGPDEPAETAPAQSADQTDAD